MGNLILLIWVVCSALVNVSLALFFGRWVPLIAYLIEVGSTFAFLFWKSGVGVKPALTAVVTAALIAAISWLAGAGVARLL